MEQETIQKYFDRMTELENQRTQWESHWQQINEYILPGQGFFLSQGQQPNQGEKRHSRIFDSTAEEAMGIFAAGMQGGLTSPSRPWFRLTLADAGLTEYGPVRGWLDFVERAMYRVFAKSNFYASVLSLYTELGGFGTSAIYEEENFKSLIWFRNCAIGEYSIAEGPDGLVDTLIRRFYCTIRQVAQKFGEQALTDTLQKSLESNPDEWIQVVHYVAPRDNGAEKKVGRTDKPFESVYLLHNNTEQPLWVGGYEEFPYFVPRWNTAGPDVWGRSPGMKILPNVKMLQEMQITSLKALHKQIDPPLRAPSSLKNLGLKVLTIPGGVNYLDSTENIGALYDVNPNLAAMEAKINNIQMAIREGLFNNLFLAILNSGIQMTAREVAERHEEKLLILGPFIERHATEFHDPMITRTFNILLRQGLIPMPPQEIMGQDLKIEYISMLAQAQRLVGTQAIRATADFVASLAQFKPDVLDKFDADEAVDQFGEMVGAPAKIIISDDRVQKIREGRARELAAQKQQEELLQGIDVAKTLSQSSTQEGNALGDLVNSLNGSAQ